MAMQKKRKPPKPGRLLHIVILVISVLVIFEGKMLVSIFSKGGVQFKVASQLSELFTGAEFQTDSIFRKIFGRQNERRRFLPRERDS